MIGGIYMSVKMKKSLLSFFRLSIQILCFILLPTLFANTFLGIKTLLLGIINKELSFTSDLPILLEVIATILLTIVIGRFFCGWMCSFGAVSDWLHTLFQKVFHYKITVPEKADKFLKYFRYIYLVILVAVIWNTESTFFNSANPWNAFATIFTLNGMPDIIGAFQYYAIGTILLLIILSATVVIERFFCRYLCPLGAIFSVFSRFKIIRIEKERSKCGSCKLCTKNCPMGIPLYQYDSITSGDCIQCQKCTQVCPRNNPTLSFDEYKVNAAIVSTLAVATISSVNYTGDVLASAAGDSSNSSSEYASSVQGQYKDGIYEGSGTGFRGGTTTVSVTVENGNISDVQVVSYEDDKPFFSRAEEIVISQIIENQSSDVDTVSGATYSSLGIMEAVENALVQARK